MQGSVKVIKITDESLMKWAFERTARGAVNASLVDAYRWEHSPIRTQMFVVELDGVALFASTHILRHTIGVTGPYIRTQREDRGGMVDEGRWSPHDHAMIVNAETLINIAKKRLCYRAHKETRAIALALREAVRKVDRALALYMVPECVYRNGLCPNPCGKMDQQMREHSYYKELFGHGV